MLNRFFGKSFHDYFHLFGISVLAVGLPSSKVILSIGTMLILLNILLEGAFKTYWQKIKSNYLFIILAAFMILHVFGLLWTSDFDYAMNDIRIKLPLLVIPLVLTSKPILSAKNLQFILCLFVATLCLTSLYNILSFNHWIGNKTYDDIRGLSLFGSHIRYGILIAVGAGISIYYLWVLRSPFKWIFLPLVLWFCYYTYYSQIISGFLALSVVFLSFIIFIAYQKSKKAGLATIFLSLGILLSPLFLFLPNFQENSTIKSHELEEFTVQGNPYKHNLDKYTFINGKPPLIYVCEKELKSEWQKHSKLDYDGLDNSGQTLRFTIMRYMASKDLRKDSVDFQKLTQRDIQFIEDGVASVEDTKTGLIARIDGIKFQVYHAGDPNGHSLLQRLEYWKTGWRIIKNNWLIGVGTGDVQKAFDKQYEIDHSALFSENRFRAHNSYLTSWISFGILGIILFVGMILSFLVIHWKKMNYLPVMFILVAASTFLLEDTLETQMGVTFFAFFYGLFITVKPSTILKYS